MSIQHVAAVLDMRRTDISGARRMVLVCLANRTNEHGECWPSQRLIGEEAGLKVRSVQDHLKALEELKIISRQTIAKGQGRGGQTTYVLHLDQLAHADNAPAKDAPANNADANSGVCTRSIPRPNNLQEPTDSLFPDWPDVERAFQDFRATAAKLGLPVPRKLTPNLRSKFRARLRTIEPEQWPQVLEQIRRSSFCQGARGWRLDIHSLCQEQTFERLISGVYADKPKLVANNPAPQTNRHDQAILDAIRSSR